MKKSLLLLLSWAITSCMAYAQCSSERYLKKTFPAARTYEDVLYNRSLALQGACLLETNIDTNEYRLDIYEPIGDSLQQRPCIVYAHGGAFLIGDKRMIPIDSFCFKMAMYGFVVVSIDYRKCFNVLSTESAIRAVYRAVQDMKAAIRFVKSHAHWLRIDTNMIIAAGNSAGAIMALHTAYADEHERAMLPATYSLPNLGCLECSGNNYPGIGKPRAVLNFWGAIIDTLIIHAGDVPMFAVHGSADNIVFPEYASPFGYPAFPPLYGSAPISRRMNNVGVINEFHYLLGFPHEPWLFTSPLYVDTFAQWASEFLYRTVLKTTPIIIAPATACTRDTFVCSAAFHEGSHYCWEVIGGTIISSANHEIKIVWHTPGIGTIRLREKNLYDALSEEVSKQIPVYSKPDADAGNDHHICQNDSAFLVGTGGIYYQWIPYEYIIGSTTSTPIVFPPNNKEYILRVFNGFCYDYDTVNITVYPLPSLVTKGDISICRGDTGIVEVVAPTSHVIWQPAAGLLDTQALSTMAFPAYTTIYSVTIVDSNGCMASDSITVFVHDPPHIPVINQYQDLLITVSGYTYQWYLNDSLLKQFTQSVIQPPANGYYRVVISNQVGCSATSDSYYYETASVISPSSNQDVHVYPNPTHGYIMLSSKNSIYCFSATLLDITGKVLWQKENIPRVEILDLSSLSGSMFLLYIRTEKGNYIQKIIKH